MNPLTLFFYLLAVAGGLCLNLLVLFVFACCWLYLIGSAKGRGE